MKIVALAGGVGGSKLAHGLAQVLAPDDLTIIVNTGDDFEHFGLNICPDLDTVCYTLAGLANPDTGWGHVNESWQVMSNIEEMGGPGWFRLGDQDLATHLERTRRLKEGQSLSAIVRDFRDAWGIKHTILPMTDGSVHTMVDTIEHGELQFQEYFVRLRCKPRVKSFRFAGMEAIEPAPDVVEAIEQSDAVVICPSNPWVSIAPILAVAGLRSRIEAKKVVAVSPIIGGQAVKGPAAKMYSEMGVQPSALAVAEHYRGLAKGFVLDKIDAHLEEDIRHLEMLTLVTNTLMATTADRRRLAEDVLDFIGLLI
jgi:LPPG:FO 2-phospho-L-lactate transferase